MFQLISSCFRWICAVVVTVFTTTTTTSSRSCSALPMSASVPGLVDPFVVQQRCHSKQAFAHIAEALRLDENSTDDNKAAALACYRRGVAELEAGIAVPGPVLAGGEEARRAQRLRQKMENNLAMTRDRLNYLESLEWMQSQSIESSCSSSPRTDNSRRWRPKATATSTSTVQPLPAGTNPAATSSCATNTTAVAPKSTAAANSRLSRRSSNTDSPSVRVQLAARRAAKSSLSFSSVQPAVNQTGRSVVETDFTNHVTAAVTSRRLTSGAAGTSVGIGRRKPLADQPSVTTSAAAAHANLSRRIPPAVLRSLDTRMANLILDEVVELPSSTTTATAKKTPGDSHDALAHVVGNEVAKRALHELVLLPAQRPELFTGLRAPVRGLLLFGPPGNGKTMLARAVAGACCSTFFNISASSLTSKWHGEGEKLVRTLFTLARHLQPSIIFMDEVDALLGERSEGEQEASRRLKTEFLCQFDGLTSSAASDTRVLVLGATNRPFDLDRAVLRRFPKRVYIQLPSCSERQLLLQQLLRQQQARALPQQQLLRLAQLTDGFSGSDITALARDAALGPIRELSREQVASADPNSLRAITVDDFVCSLKRVRKSVSGKTLAQFESFQAEYGDLTT